MKSIQNITVNSKNINIINDIDEEIESIIINTPVDKEYLLTPFKYTQEYSKLVDYINKVIDLSYKKLKIGGCLFVYGLPNLLPYLVDMSYNRDLEFRYWIALEVANTKRPNNILKQHMGLLMFTKGKNKPFYINIDNVRLPYVACSACGRNIKDWGGKKHLMNKSGTCISDVWKDFYSISESYPDKAVEGITLNKIDVNRSLISSFDIIPDVVLNRLVNLTDNGGKCVNIICQNIEYKKFVPVDVEIKNENKKTGFTENSLFVGDSIELMEDWIQKGVENCFDIIFADPPYNLDKSYNNYSDKEDDKNYIEWCDKWLKCCSKLLKPNGSLFVLNIPKWAVFHSKTLNELLYFQNWIVWDALSAPRGKIMPAHYSLLHYSKSPEFTYNDNNAITKVDSAGYCIRNSCIKNRKKNGDDRKVELSDIWTDIFRIKHKKDRDNHPCQLPEKLLERIIQLFSNENDVIFDPFCGVGTTPVTAYKLKRKYVSIDISKEYIDITNEKINQIENNGELLKIKTERKAKKFTKKEIEVYIQNVTSHLKHIPSKQELEIELNKDSNIDFTIDDITEIYGELKIALKSGRIVLKQIS